jgi:hypothetical protein
MPGADDTSVEFLNRIVICEGGLVEIDSQSAELDIQVSGTPFVLGEFLSGVVVRLGAAPHLMRQLDDLTQLLAREISARPENQQALGRTADRLRKAGVPANASPALLLLVILIWISAVVLPVIETDLPVKTQTVITNELATIGVALALVDHIRGKKK